MLVIDVIERAFSVALTRGTLQVYEALTSSDYHQKAVDGLRKLHESPKGHYSQLGSEDF